MSSTPSNTPDQTRTDVIAASTIECRGVTYPPMKRKLTIPVLEEGKEVTALVTTFRSGFADVACPMINKGNGRGSYKCAAAMQQEFLANGNAELRADQLPPCLYASWSEYERKFLEPRGHR